MNFHIRKAIKDDAKHILNLIKELAVFENEPNAVEINKEDIGHCLGICSDNIDYYTKLLNNE